MLYCLNPQCTNPKIHNPEATTCLNCGSSIVLQDRYVAIQPIAQGGFGRTFLAVDRALAAKPRHVIKQFFPKLSGVKSRALAIRLFQQEAIQLEKLGSHAHIPRLIAHFEQNGHCYLIQEYIDGRDLLVELQASGPFSEEQIWQVLQHLLPILKFIHQHQIIHRDIKPANIIRRSSDNGLVLVDLGAAKQATGEGLAQTGTVIGSAEYTAPEQARGKAVFASDIYSLGVTCIHLLTEISPFNLFDNGDSQWIWRDYLKQSISELLSQTLDQMIVIPTNHRFQTIEQIQAFISAGRSPQSRLPPYIGPSPMRQRGRKQEKKIPHQRVYREPKLAPKAIAIKRSVKAPITVSAKSSGRRSNQALARRDHASIGRSRFRQRNLAFLSIAAPLLMVGSYLWVRSNFTSGLPNSRVNDTTPELDQSKTLSPTEPTTGLPINSDTLSPSADVTISEAMGFVFPVISDDSQFLSVLGINSEIKVWRIESGAMENQREVNFSSIGVTYDQRAHIFSAEGAADLKMHAPPWMENPRTIDDFKVPEPEDLAVSYLLSLSPDHASLVGYTPYISGSGIGTIEFNIWDLETDEAIVKLAIPSISLDEAGDFFEYPRFPISTGLYHKGLQFFSADGQWGLAPKPNGIEIWNLRTATKQMDIAAIAATFSPNPTVLITENHQQVQFTDQLTEGVYTEVSDIQLWNLNTQQPIVKLGSGNLSFTADGDNFVFYDRPFNKISFFDTLSGTALYSFESDFLPDARVFLQMTISPDGKWLAGFIEDFPASPREVSAVHNTWVLWDVQTGQVIGAPQKVNQPAVPFHILRLFEFTPDGRHLLLGKDYSLDGSLIEIWRIP